MSVKERIKRNKCNKCGFIQDISHLRCIRCKSKTFSKEIAPDTCTLLSYTILTAPPMEFRDKKSYALGIVEFDNGMRALGQITTQEKLEIGMILKPIYKKICDNLDNNEVYAHVFEPIE